MKRAPVVAIDGPAGSGKSTVAKRLAQRLQFTHIDTGALYRGVAWLALQSGASLDDESQVVSAAQPASLNFCSLPEGNLLHINGVNRAEEIRAEPVGRAASKVSAYPAVRAMLLDFQRQLGQGGGVVLEGRDIGTVVFPHAEVKIFLTASLEARVARRGKELQEKGEVVDSARLQLEMAQRDRQDSERQIAPLRQAEDAILLDTSTMSIESVLDQLESIVNGRR